MIHLSSVAEIMYYGERKLPSFEHQDNLRVQTSTVQDTGSPELRRLPVQESIVPRDMSH